ncbi:MAG: hypothetical protein LBG80_13355 [Bacteroidales bacterium]|jgi:hypothetical protein|nr:hypothetical protein [Bacteroidales bacterium]
MNKIIKIFLPVVCTATFAVASVISMSVNENKDSQDVTVQELAVATKANAECISTGFDNGRCSFMDNTCWYAGRTHPLRDCDTYAW